jgi:hypothetical protein
MKYALTGLLLLSNLALLCMWGAYQRQAIALAELHRLIIVQSTLPAEPQRVCGLGPSE